MLKIENLNASIDGKEIIKDLNLDIKQGEVHALMGPNGSGKSTLANILAGRPGYDIDGHIFYQGKDLLTLSIEERAQQGLFMAFQYPVEVPGVNTSNFLKTSLNSIRRSRGEKELDPLEFITKIQQKAKALNIDKTILTRQLNVGFSGGEKKKNEVLQMSILEPTLAILDETDSGLDIDALRIVSDGVNVLKSKERSFLIITHYQRLLEYIKPDFVHVMINGTIDRTGCEALALELEKSGYGNTK